MASFTKMCHWAPGLSRWSVYNVGSILLLLLLLLRRRFRHHHHRHRHLIFAISSAAEAVTSFASSFGRGWGVRCWTLNTERLLLCHHEFLLYCVCLPLGNASFLPLPVCWRGSIKESSVSGNRKPGEDRIPYSTLKYCTHREACGKKTCLRRCLDIPLYNPKQGLCVLFLPAC